MSDKARNFIVSISFVFALILLFILNILKKDDLISITERRKLASFPEISKQALLSGDFSDKFENYSIDQFVGRDFFKKVKYHFNDKVLMQSDTNGLFIKDNSIYKLDYKLNKSAIENTIDVINYVKNEYLADSKVYYSIIPDKMYYLSDDYLKLNYEEIQNTMKEKLTDFEYIDIFENLSLDDYYRTDLHWKQESLSDVVNTILNRLIGDNYKRSEYSYNEISDFNGAYSNQLVGARVEPDKIIYLTNDTINNSKTYNVEKNEYKKVYNLEKLSSPDKYDIFVSGATPIISIINENSETDRKLFLFRDSFGSSLAPLLIDNYKEITLIDLRYISSKILDEYIDFNGEDVLFLYSGTILNSGTIR